MSGMDMLLRTMGVDPTEIQKQIGQMGELFQKIGDSLTRIEAKQNEQDTRLTRIEGLLVADVAKDDA